MRVKSRTIFTYLLILGLLLTSIPLERVKADEKTETDPYTIQCVKESSWEGGYVAKIILTNHSSETLENWGLRGIVPGKVMDVWNGTIETNGTRVNELRLVGQSFNRDVEPGQSVSVGIRVSDSTFDEMKDFKLMEASREYIDTGFSVEYQITSSWGNQANISGVIHNDSEKVIEDWKLLCEFDGAITNIWNAKVESVSGSAVVIDNLGYNRDIEAKGETSFGFICTYGDSEKGTCPTDTQLMCVNGRVEDSAEQSEWNRKMIGAESEEVQAARTPVDGRVKVAMLDSGINYSEKVNVVERANFLPDADPETENDLMDDPTGHGTAAASLLAATGEKSPVEEAGELIEDETEPVEEPTEEEEWLDWDESEEDLDEESEEDLEEESEEDSDITEETGDDEESDSEEDEISFSEIIEDQEDDVKGINPNVDIYSAKVLDENNQSTVLRIVNAIDWAIEKEVNIIQMSFGISKK